MLIHWNQLTKDEFLWYRDKAAVAINFASTEQHSVHLPVGTDAIIGRAVVEAAALAAASPVIVLPQVCFGFSPHHRFADGYITISQDTLMSYAADICHCVYENGFRRMFLINSHGGNQAYLLAVVNEIGAQYKDFSLIELRYWDVAGPRIMKIRESGIGGMSHAGEFETSVMMYLAPELVHAELIPQSPPAMADEWYQVDLLGSKKYVRFINFNKYNVEGHVGQPQLATEEKGKLFFEAVTQELARFIDHYHYNG